MVLLPDKQYAWKSDRKAVIVGADSFIGSCLARTLAKAGCDVQSVVGDYMHYNIPQECGLVLFCHDAFGDRDLHTRAFSALCEHLAATRSAGRQVHLCYFSTANICDGDGRQISEKSSIHPHNLYELAVCQAEMTLNAWVCLSRGVIVPNIFRHGELYGDADAPRTDAGHVNECLRLARDGKPLTFCGNLGQKRTLLHVEDFAYAVVALLSRDIIPNLINIPGETLNIYDYLSAISDHYHVELNIGTQRRFSENLPPYSCDRVLSASVFRSELDFKPKHRFKTWLLSQCLMPNS